MAGMLYCFARWRWALTGLYSVALICGGPDKAQFTAAIQAKCPAGDCRQRAWEQHVILSADVLHQIINHLINAVTSLPCGAGFGGGVTFWVT